MKHRGGNTSNQLEKIRAAQERKREQMTRLLARKSSESVPLRRDEARPESSTAEIVVEQLEPASLGLRLRADDVSVELHPVRAIGVLAAEMLRAAETREPRAVLLWPGSLRSLGLAHAVATGARWQAGDKRGIRTILYPAKANFLSALNHAHVDREDMVQLARELYEDGTGCNKRVTVSLREKDPFWLSLNNLNPTVADRIHPSLAELLPHFFATKDFTGWRACDGDLLRHIKSNLKHVADRRVLTQHTIKKLSDPVSAPDALFAISWKATRSDIRAALRELERAERPDLLVLDLTRALRKDNPSWKANVLMFLECFRKAYPEDTPPALVVFDEPHVRNQLVKELSKSATKKGEVSKWLLGRGLPVDGVVCTVGRDGLANDQRMETSPSEKVIHVSITDTEAAEVIALLERIRDGISEPEWLEAFDEAEKYLARLAALPSSTRVLIRWLGEADVPTAVRENYAWPVFRSKLERIVHDPTFKKRTLLKQAIERGSALWENYENGTPMARKLADLIEEHTRGNERCCVAFTRPTARRLAERYFETYDGYPEGAGFEVLKDCVRFVVSRDLETEIEHGRNETIVFSGLDEESLRILLVEDRISSPVYVLLTRRNAAYLRATLKAISAIPGFAALRSRVDAILKQLPDFPGEDEHSFLSRTDFVLPTFSFEHGLSSQLTVEDDHDENAWELLLDSGARLRRSPQSNVYVYSPALSHTPSRGFRSAEVGSLEEGDHLFVMSVELREMTEAALKEAGIPISNDRHFESALRQYHQRVCELVRMLPGATLTEKSRSLWPKIEAQLGAKGQMPAEGTLRSWMDVDRFRGVSFENAKPGAPRQEAHFKAFVGALGLHDYEAVYFWKAVIQPLRGVRRADGRRVSDAYADLLLDPESAVVHKRMRHAVVQALFACAKENVHVVEAIGRPLETA